MTSLALPDLWLIWVDLIYVSINSKYFSHRTKKSKKKKKKLKTELKNLSHSSHAFALSKGTIFAPKYWFSAKTATCYSFIFSGIY